MGELHTGTKHPLSGADPESYFDLNVVPLDTSQKERATAGTWRSITRLTPGVWSLLTLVGSTPRRGELR